MRNTITMIAALSVLAAGAVLASRHAAVAAPGPVSSTGPHGVRVKFEWVGASGNVGAKTDKSVEALTLVAQEGRTARISTQHVLNGAGAQETVSALPHLETGGVVSLDITERNDITARGETKSNSSQTTVRIKDGRTELVRGLATTQGGAHAERMLFVTPTVLQSGS